MEHKQVYIIAFLNFIVCFSEFDIHKMCALIFIFYPHVKH